MSKENDHKLRTGISKKLYAERLMNRMSQQELAEKLGTHKSNISRLENGRQNISVDYLEMLADALDKEVLVELRERGIPYGEKTKYTIRLYDDVLMSFSMKQDTPVPDISVIDVNEDLRHLFPPDLEPDSKSIYNWLKQRVIPSNRELVGRILSALGLRSDDLKGIIDICLGLSLNDSYWVTPADFDGTFDKYDLFDNEFNTALSLIAYAGYGDVSGRLITTPELTTGGTLRKAWRNKGEDGIWLYKSGTSGFANSGLEPYSEFYACQIAECMGLNAVHYELENWYHILASKCRLFTDKNTSYVPIGRIIHQGGIDAVIDHYKELGDSFYQELASMLVFDGIIMNEDRHFGNFGLMRDNHTGRYISPAPIFDNGNSLLCRAMKTDFDGDIQKYIDQRANPYGWENNFLKLCEKVIGPKQKKQVRKLIGFTFTESDLTNLPSWRLKALEKIIQNRVRLMLGS